MSKTIKAMSSDELMSLWVSIPTEKEQIANLSRNQCDALYHKLSIAIMLLIEKELLEDKANKNAV